MNMLAAMSWPQFILAVVMIMICLFLMIVIMVQRGRGQGLAGAFGGGGGGGGAFGAKTGDVFTWITVVIAMLFLLVNVAGNFVLDQTPTVAATELDSDEIVPPPEAPATDDAPTITLNGTTDTGEPVEVKVGDTTEIPPVTPPADAGTTAPDAGTVAPSETDTPSDGNDDEE